jgi:hypothetical protein
VASFVSPVLWPAGPLRACSARRVTPARSPPTREASPIKRVVIILALAVGFVVPAVANASRVATGSTKTAIIRADRSSPVHNGRFPPQRCLIARITTKDGGDWAKVSFNAAKEHSCADWVFNGADVLQRAGRRWHYVTSGSADIQCGQLRIPVAVRLDLHLACAVALPTGPRADGSFGVYEASRKATETSRRAAQDAPRANVAAEHFRACGNFNLLHVGIDVHRVSCAKSRRIVRAYLHGKSVGVDFAQVKGFPAWTCSTGDRSGGCEKGGFARGVPQIDFFYLEPPG